MGDADKATKLAKARSERDAVTTVVNRLHDRGLKRSKLCRALRITSAQLYIEVMVMEVEDYVGVPPTLLE